MPKFLANLDGSSAVKGVNFVDPTAPQDLATKNYVDTRPDADVTKFAASVGDGVAVSYVVTHSLNTKDVLVQFRQNADDVAIMTDWTATSVNTVTVTFSTAPATNAIRVIVLG